jgi:hypothetical protein
MPGLAAAYVAPSAQLKPAASIAGIDTGINRFTVVVHVIDLCDRYRWSRSSLEVRSLDHHQIMAIVV